MRHLKQLQRLSADGVLQVSWVITPRQQHHPAARHKAERMHDQTDS
jgi:hypothetical protein